MCNNHTKGNDHNHDHGHQDTTTPEKITTSIKVLFEPLVEQGVTDDLKKELAAIRALPPTEQKEVVQRLEKLVHEYPQVVSLHSSLAYMYEMNKESEKAEQHYKQSVEKFPADILAKTAYAGFFLRKGDLASVATLFSNMFDIKALYPERAQFYALEVLEFYGVSGLYYAAAGKRSEAYNCLTLIKKIDPKSGYAVSIGDMLGIPREDDPHYAQFFKLLKKERAKVRTK